MERTRSARPPDRNVRKTIVHVQLESIQFTQQHRGILQDWKIFAMQIDGHAHDLFDASSKVGVATILHQRPHRLHRSRIVIRCGSRNRCCCGCGCPGRCNGGGRGRDSGAGWTKQGAKKRQIVGVALQQQRREDSIGMQRRNQCIRTHSADAVERQVQKLECGVLTQAVGDG
jgi:hypothetical protein